MVSDAIRIHNNVRDFDIVENVLKFIYALDQGTHTESGFWHDLKNGDKRQE